jgi:predicted ArsR family transcriptional regulator
MQPERFFQTTRGKIVVALRRRRAASAVELATEFGLSPNAIRQQLVLLERDGLVTERSVRRGPTKPTFEFSLTPRAETLFPQRYDRMLNAVLREVREAGGPEAVAAIFRGMGKRAAEKFQQRIDAGDSPGKVRELAELLHENGVEAEAGIASDGTLLLREHNCPFAEAVAENPEVCSVIHAVLSEVVPGDVRQVESLATGGQECRFEIKVG